MIFDTLLICLSAEHVLESADAVRLFKTAIVADGFLIPSQRTASTQILGGLSFWEVGIRVWNGRNKSSGFLVGLAEIIFKGQIAVNLRHGLRFCRNPTSGWKAQWTLRVRAKLAVLIFIIIQTYTSAPDGFRHQFKCFLE